jgi:hypothetical protein
MSAYKTTNILNAVTAANGTPSAGTDGVKVPPGCNRGLFSMRSTAGSGVMDVTLRLWGYVEGQWYPHGPGAGVGAASTQGVLNRSQDGETIYGKYEEIAADVLKAANMVDHLDVYERVYVEVVDINGTATAVTVDAHWYRPFLRAA